MISNTDYDLLEWYQCGASADTIAPHIPELVEKSHISKEVLTQRWVRPYNLAYLVTQKWGKE